MEPHGGFHYLNRRKRALGFTDAKQITQWKWIHPCGCKKARRSPENSPLGPSQAPKSLRGQGLGVVGFGMHKSKKNAVPYSQDPRESFLRLNGPQGFYFWPQNGPILSRKVIFGIFWRFGVSGQVCFRIPKSTFFFCSPFSKPKRTSIRGIRTPGNRFLASKPVCFEWKGNFRPFLWFLGFR